jgi:hypothetical protein
MAMGAHRNEGIRDFGTDSYDDLKKYFERERPITAFTLPTTRSNAYTFNANLTSLFSTVWTTGIERLRGVYGIRFTTKYRFQVATTPFHQGLYNMCVQYMVAGTDTTTSFLRANKPYACTMVPHVRMDLSMDTMVELSVPFVSDFDFYAITAQNTTWINTPYHMMCVNALLGTPTVAGLSAATAQVYISLTDMELIFPVPYGLSLATPQGAISAEDRAMKPSDYVKIASSTIKFLAPFVPSLASITAPAIWVTDAAAGVLTSWGFSRPTVQERNIRVNRFRNINEQNVDVPSVALVPACTIGNTLTPSPEFGYTDADEMSLEYVLTRFSQIFTGQITTIQPVGQTAYIINVSPSSMWYRSQTGANAGNTILPTTIGASGNCVYPSGAMYFSSMFRYWRGGFKFRFTFAKTNMHGGRVAITFVPNMRTNSRGVNNSGLVPTLVAGTYSPDQMTLMINLRDAQVVEYDVPFISPVPYLLYDDVIGTLSMSIVNPLVAPSLVSPSIDFMVEVACLPSFELACPVSPLYAPINNGGSVVLQSSAGSASNALTQVADKCVGEKLTSLKQLIMVPTVSVLPVINGLDTINKCFMPWYFSPLTAVPSPTISTTTLPSQAFAFGGVISSCYLFVMGGTDVHVYDQGYRANVVGNYAALPVQRTVTYSNTALMPPSSNMPSVIDADLAAAHVRYPAFQRAVRYASWLYNNQTWSPVLWNGVVSGNLQTIATPARFIYPQALPRMSIYVGSATSTSYVITRAGADDAYASGYMGPPHIFVPSVSSIVVPYDSDYSALMSQ